MEFFRKAFPANKYQIRIAGWTIAAILIWLFLWLFPWQVVLHGSVWIRLGLALIVFTVPGMAFHGLLAGETTRWINHVTYGFVISHFLFAFLSTLGRIAHVSFDLIVNLMMGLGGVLLVFYLVSKLSQGFHLRFDRAALNQLASFWTLGIVSVFVILIVLQREFSDDDLSYLAFLTNTQSSAQLGFTDIFFGLSQSVSPRFWLMSVPFTQAFLANLSDIPGLLILGGYYEPFLAIIAILCWYELARCLRLSHRGASVSVILQILFLLLLSEYLHPGAPFFHQLSTDKATATFILAPVFIQSGVSLLNNSSRNNTILFLLCGLSLTFMHPIALAYAAFIFGAMVVLDINRGNLWSRSIPLLLIFVTLLPQVILRFIGTRVEENVPYGLDVILSQNGIRNMITLWGDTQFYGFNPQALAMTFPYGSNHPILDLILKWGWLLILVGALLFAIQEIKHSSLARYIFSAFLLCVLAGIPFTGWIIGYFLSAWALERTLWLFPFGLSAVFLLLSIRHGTMLGRRIDSWIRKLPDLPLVVVTFFTSAVLVLYAHEHGLPDLPKFETRINRYVDIVETGRYLDDRIEEQAFVMGSDALNDLIPGVSAEAKLITFRTSDYFSMSLFPVTEIEQRIADRRMIFSETTSPDVKLELLGKYDVRFIILTRADRDLFMDLLAAYPSLTRMEKVNRFFIIEVKGE